MTDPEQIARLRVRRDTLRKRHQFRIAELEELRTIGVRKVVRLLGDLLQPRVNLEAMTVLLIPRIHGALREHLGREDEVRLVILITILPPPTGSAIPIEVFAFHHEPLECLQHDDVKCYHTTRLTTYCLSFVQGFVPSFINPVRELTQTARFILPKNEPGK